LNIKLEAPLTSCLVSLLNQALTTSRWLETEIGVTVKINAGKTAQGLAHEPMAVALDADKPRYLN
jgi:hypothetical protein